MASEVRRELARRWVHMLQRVAAGDDIPPSLRLRAEGLMEALVLGGEASAEELQSAMCGCHLQELGHSLDSVLGGHWREHYPFPQIPFFQQRAPVYPSTRESL